MLKLLHGRGDIWPEITGLVSKQKQNRVAVAFISGKAGEMLPLNAGDTLVVDMSPERVKSGATNPSAVRRFCEKGVSVFTYGGLHSKLFILGNRTVVGSTNVSSLSRSHLDEAVLMSNEESIRQRAEKYIGELVENALPVTELMLKKREAQFRPSNYTMAVLPEGSPKAGL